MAGKSGIARVDVDVVDLSALINTGLKGVAGVIGITERGVIGKPVLVGSWLEFVREFGGLRSDTQFPLYCRRALEAGAKLYVSRVGAYTDLTNKTTLQGTKAEHTKVAVVAAAVPATAGFTIVTAGATGSTWSLIINGVTVKTYVQAAGATPTIIATGLSTGLTGGYTVTGTTATRVVNAPTGTGASYNGYSVMVINSGVGGTGTATTTNFTGGVDAVTVAGTITFIAKSEGDWANNIGITIENSVNGNTATVDITVNAPDYPDMVQTYRNFPKTGYTTKDINQFNAIMKFVDIKTGFPTGSVPIGVTTNSVLGVYDISLLNVAHYIGDPVGQTGVHAFDNNKEIVRIAVPEIATPLLDAKLINYADTRKDIMAVLRTPVGIDDKGMVDYREGTATGAYPHGVFDSWRAVMLCGGINVVDPYDNSAKDISEIGDALGAMSRTDNQAFEWFAFAGSKRGRVINANGVVFNLGSSARRSQADNVVNRGLIPVIDHESFGTVFWGNRTLWKSATLLRYYNVASLVLFLNRALKPLVQSELLDPNDVQTWKNIYRKVKPLLDYVKENRGFWDYLYQGDQDITTLSQAVVNDPASIDNGEYCVNLWIQPKVALEYIGIKLAITNSGVDFSELIGEPLNI